MAGRGCLLGVILLLQLYIFYMVFKSIQTGNKPAVIMFITAGLKPAVIGFFKPVVMGFSM